MVVQGYLAVKSFVMVMESLIAVDIAEILSEVVSESISPLRHRRP